MNYYVWILWQEEVLEKHSKKEYSLANKLDLSNKRKSLSVFKEKLIENEPVSCFYCGKRLSFDETEIDHFIPWSFVKDDQIWNLVPCCKKCNIDKSDKLASEKWLKEIEKRNSCSFKIEYNHKLELLYNAAKYNGLKEWNK